MSKSVDHDFAAVEPLLWRALGALARNGFVAGPGDARDLVHDFYLDAWEGVQQRFDDRLGSFGTYLAASFYRFARRRIAVLHSWRQNLVDIDELARTPSSWDTPAEVLEQRQDTLAMKAALARLPIRERTILQDYLSEDGSERAVAHRHGLTRYALRERLLSAVGRLAVDLGKIDATKMESLVAYYLWRESRSPKNVGALLGLSTAEVQRYKTVFASDLLSSIRSTHSATTNNQGEITMPSLDKLRTVLLGPQSAEALMYLRDHASEFRVLLEEDPDIEFSEEEAAKLAQSPEWLAAAYEALGTYSGEEDRGRAAQEVERALAELTIQESSEVGDAFAALLDVLPGEFARWDIMPPAELVHPAYQAHMRSDPSFDSASGRYIELASRGLSPSVFVEVARGLELLFDRVLENGPFSERVDSDSYYGLPLVILWDDSERREATVDSALLLAQVRTSPGLPPDFALPIAQWMLAASQYRPLLIRGYSARSHRDAVVFSRQPVPIEREDGMSALVWRWSSPEAGLEPHSTSDWSLIRPSETNADSRAA